MKPKYYTDSELIVSELETLATLDILKLDEFMSYSDMLEILQSNPNLYSRIEDKNGLICATIMSEGKDYAELWIRSEKDGTISDIEVSNGIPPVISGSFPATHPAIELLEATLGKDLSYIDSRVDFDIDDEFGSIADISHGFRGGGIIAIINMHKFDDIASVGIKVMRDAPVD